MKKLLAMILFLTSVCSLPSRSQCIDRDKIKPGGDDYGADYVGACPRYDFAYHGDSSNNWNVFGKPIEIKDAPQGVFSIKKRVDEAIKRFSGDEFFSYLKFTSVEIAYPGRLSLFKEKGNRYVSITRYDHRAKYVFHYAFTADTLAIYNISLTVNTYGKIISSFMFPPKKWYHPIDRSITYCELFDIARKAQPDIEPIEEISLEFDTKSQRFLWLISQSVDHSHEGNQFINQVFIDAADLAKVQTSKTEVSVIY
jgi:hypothetical protein